MRNPHARAVGITEVNKFNEEPLLPRTGNPLTFWIERRQVYQALLVLGKKRLSAVNFRALEEYFIGREGSHREGNRLTRRSVTDFVLERTFTASYHSAVS
jgi:hypothetical protein